MASARVGIGKKILGAAKKALIGDSPKFLFVGQKAYGRALGATKAEALSKIPGLKYVLGAAHWQDIKALNPKSSLKDYAKAMSKIRGGSMYIHNSQTIPDKKLFRIKELAKKFNVKAINADPDVAEYLSRDKLRMGKMLGSMGAGGDKDLPATARGMKRFLNNPKNQDKFIKSKWGAEGSGIMGKVKDLKPKEREWLLSDIGMREGHLVQNPVSVKKTLTGGLREFRVHARDRKVVDIGGRHNLAIPSKKEKSAIKDVVEKYHKKLERGGRGAEMKENPKLIAYDIAFNKSNKPVIHEYQPGSGLHAHALSGALRKLVKHETGQDMLVRRVGKRLAVGGGVAGTAVAGKKLYDKKKRPLSSRLKMKAQQPVKKSIV